MAFVFKVYLLPAAIILTRLLIYVLQASSFLISCSSQACFPKACSIKKRNKTRCTPQYKLTSASELQLELYLKTINLTSFKIKTFRVLFGTEQIFLNLLSYDNFQPTQMLSYSRKHLQRCSPSLSFVCGSNLFKLPSFKFDMYTTLLNQEENYRRYKHRDKCKHSVRCLHQFGPTNETSDMHKSSCFH